ncbi:MAG TPA: DMT family transporter [Gammaproteobacteria bacterium]|jgi:drug/metabolite transporter (DMT)-like permease|nr:DMT family transporter [Gammaproteobacteria bacterium]
MNQTLTKKDYAIGYTELTLAQCCVGINVICGKFLIGFFPIFLLLTIRFAIGFLGMLAIARLKGIKFLSTYHHFVSLSMKDKLLLIFQAACGGFLFNVFILYGMKTTSATSAGIISSITPIMIFILAAVLLHEKITLQKSVSIVMVVVGLVILNMGMASDAMQGAFLGNCLVLLAVVPEALFTILSKSVGKKITEMEAVILVNLFNLILFIPFAAMSFSDFHPVDIARNAYGLLLIYGLSGGIMFFLLWYRGLTKIKANTAALFTGVMPVSTTILAFIFLQEPVHLSEIIGMLLVIAAIFVGCRKQPLLKSRIKEIA